MCKGRIQIEFQIFTPPTTKLAEKIVMHKRVQTLNDNVGMKMSKTDQDPKWRAIYFVRM